MSLLDFKCLSTVLDSEEIMTVYLLLSDLSQTCRLLHSPASPRFVGQA